jgi:hypothetical protein
MNGPIRIGLEIESTARDACRCRRWIADYGDQGAVSSFLYSLAVHLPLHIPMQTGARPYNYRKKGYGQRVIHIIYVITL